MKSCLIRRRCFRHESELNYYYPGNYQLLIFHQKRKYYYEYLEQIMGLMLSLQIFPEKFRPIAVKATCFSFCPVS